MVRSESKNNQQSGIVTLVSVLLISVVGLAIAASLLIFSTNQSKNDLIIYQHSQAKAIADACAEQALMNLKSNSSFSGQYNLILGSGACDYDVQQAGGGNVTINVSAYVSAAVSRWRIIIDQVSPSISIVSWRPVADFN
jgi:hypothetical protein